MLVSGLPPEVAARVVTVGGLSRFPVASGAAPVPRGGGVLVLGGSGGDAWTPEQLDLLRRDAGRPVRELGGAAGWDPDPATALAAAAVVVVHAGQNALAEVAAARVPAVVVPAERPHHEQHATARALAAGDWPVRVLPTLAHDDWPGLLDEVAALDGRRWSAWCDGDAAARFADVVRTVGNRR
nr:glycosyltransferase [Nocardioides zeae]